MTRTPFGVESRRLFLLISPATLAGKRRVFIAGRKFDVGDGEVSRATRGNVNGSKTVISLCSVIVHFLPIRVMSVRSMPVLLAERCAVRVARVQAAEGARTCQSVMYCWDWDFLY